MIQYTAISHRPEGRSVSSPIQGATSLSPSGIGTTSPDGSLSDTHHPVSRTAPYDNEQRYSRLQRDGLVSRRDKSMTHFQDSSQPLRRNISGSGMEPLGFGKKNYGGETEEDGKLAQSDASEKTLATKAAQGLAYVQTSSEDEDICPTCLDGNVTVYLTNLLVGLKHTQKKSLILARNKC